MAIPLRQAAKIGFYIFKQKVKRRKKYPLVLMLEPLFRCNLECVGCGKIQKSNEILKQYLTLEQCLGAANECGAPVVSVAGGEPLMHPRIVEIVEGLLAQGRYVYLCTNALLLHKYLDRLPVSPLLNLSIHLDGNEEEHDRIVDRKGTYQTAIAAIREAKRRGFRVTCNTTLFDGVSVEEASGFFDSVRELRVDGITVSSGFHYQLAPDQDIFMGRKKTHDFFSRLLAQSENGRRWDFNHSPLYLEFLCGGRDYDCTPWGNPNYSVLGWQRPCYLLEDGYAQSYKELMEETDWSKYGHRHNPKCANCTAHCGYEATAVEDAASNFSSMLVAMKAVF